MFDFINDRNVIVVVALAATGLFSLIAGGIFLLYIAFGVVSVLPFSILGGILVARILFNHIRR
jgi:hypothetical protein